MKKRKLNLSKLSLKKDVISNLSQLRLVGGASTTTDTYFASCLCITAVNCPTKRDTCNFCTADCPPTLPPVCID
ncbi:class I lanthipeptide [Chitinophaga qingshengii]|uniref:Class I lanthipeptide n=1 Tax=Chitinophaga qingshengii TaxID=1569794 RepID=A0ABR7TVV2_9BACT|nr:class I lanthipeptide [Chitinophaga qingshengii]